MAFRTARSPESVPERGLSQPPRRAMKVYSALLRLTPARFRARHGAEMTMLFADRYRDAVARPGGRIFFWAGTVRDAVRTAFAEHQFGNRFLRGSGNDARYAARALTARPAITALVIVVLALGLGASLTGWVLLRDVLLRPLPYPEADRLVAIWDHNQELGLEHIGPSPANMADWREQTRTFDGMAAWYANEPRTLAGAGDPVKVAVAEVTEDFFGLLREPALLGTAFGASEVLSDEPVVVLSHWLWVERFGGDDAIVGRTIELDGVSHRVTGVMPDSFAIPQRDIGVWVPWNFATSWPNLGFVPRDYRYLFVVARLGEGMTLDMAQADLDSVAAGLAERYAENAGWEPRITPLRDDIVGDLRPALVVLYGAVSLVLLIAMINAAHLVLGRELARRSELGMRAALGASTYRLARQAAFEAMFVTGIAALWAWAFAAVALRGVALVAPATLPRLHEIGLDVAGVAYLAAAAAVSSAVLLAVALVTGRRARVASTVRLRGAATSRWQGSLIVGQVGSTFALTALALVLATSLAGLLAVDPGFDPDNVLVARVFPDPAVYNDVPKRLAYFDELHERVASLPGVTAVGSGSGLPLNAYNNTPSVRYGAADQPLAESGPEAVLTMASLGFFDALRIPLLAGRLFDEGDTMEGEQVLVVNEQFARSLWPDGDAVGKQVQIGFGPGRESLVRVIGVVAGQRSDGLKQVPTPEAYRAHAQSPYVTMNVAVRADRVNANLESAVRREILAIDPTQPVHSITTMRELVGADVATDRFALWLVGALTALALVLAGAGIYGVMSHAVRSRTHEIGVRKALGAARGRIAGSVIGRVLSRSAIGIVLGVAGALIGRGLLEGFLFDVSATEPRLLLAAAALVVVAMALAAWLPARRASRVDAAIALRAES